MQKDWYTAFTKEMIGICRKVEPDFFRFGKALQTIQMEAEELVKKIIGVAQGYSRITGDGAFGSVVRLAKQSLSELENERVRTAGNLIHVEEIGRTLLDLFKMNSILGRIAKDLRVIGTGIKIESARLEKDGDVFEGLSEETKDLAGRVKEISILLVEDIRSAGSRIKTLREVVGRILESLSNLVPAAQESLDRTVPEVNRVFEISKEMLAQAEGQTVEIARRISELVVGIQIHDSVSQRVDHIAKALTGKVNHSDQQISIFFLQLDQLDRIIAEIEAGHENATRSLTELNCTVETLLQTLSVICLGRTDALPYSGGSENPVHSLKRGLCTVKNLLNQGSSAIANFNKVTEEASASAAFLESSLGKINVINFEIHLNALNAIAGAHRLGLRGKSVSILIREMKELSGQSSGFVRSVETAIKSIAAECDALKAGECLSGALSSPGSDCLERGIQEFVSSCEDLEDNSEKILHRLTELRKMTITATRSLQFLKHFSEELKKSRDKLRCLVDRHFPSGKGEIESTFDAASIEHLSGNYTMVQERSVHESFTGRSSGKDSGEYRFREGMDHKETLFGDNVELF